MVLSYVHVFIPEELVISSKAEYNLLLESHMVLLHLFVNLFFFLVLFFFFFFVDLAEDVDFFDSGVA